MAPSIMTTSLSNTFAYGRSSKRFKLYSCTVEDFDGEEMQFELTAGSESEAANEAQKLAASQGMYNVYNVFVMAY